MKKTNKGITLIALIVTIIVLIILAGVAIAMLRGDNGITTKTTQAKSKNAYATAKEQIQLTYTGVQTEIQMQSVYDPSYDARSGELLDETSNFGKLVSLVKKDLGITTGNSTSNGKWKVESREGTRTDCKLIKITYTDSSITKESGANSDGKVVSVIKVEAQKSQVTYDMPTLESEGLTLGETNNKVGADWKIIGMDLETPGNVLFSKEPDNSYKCSLFGCWDWEGCVEKLNEQCKKNFNVTMDGDKTYYASSINECDILELTGYEPGSEENTDEFYGKKLKDLGTLWDKIKKRWLEQGYHLRDR